MVCLSNPSENTIRALRNIRGVHLVSPEQVNAFTVLQARSLVASPEAFKVLESRIAD